MVISHHLYKERRLHQTYICFHPSCRPPPKSGSEKSEVNQKVTSNQLKIGQRVGIGLAVIAIRASNACQNSYGFGAI